VNKLSWPIVSFNLPCVVRRAHASPGSRKNPLETVGYQ